jgi:hypothetical protein
MLISASNARSAHLMQDARSAFSFHGCLQMKAFLINLKKKVAD